jgi:hypothetical protein
MITLSNDMRTNSFLQTDQGDMAQASNDSCSRLFVKGKIPKTTIIRSKSKKGSGLTEPSGVVGRVENFRGGCNTSGDCEHIRGERVLVLWAPWLLRVFEAPLRFRRGLEPCNQVSPR